MNTNQLTRIFLFYLIAIIGSNLIRFNLLGTDEFFASLPIWTKAITMPLQSLGVFIGSLVGIYLLSKKRKTVNSLLGTSSKWSLMMVFIPILVFGTLGIENNAGLSKHFFGIVIALGLLIYCIFEEYGWRGYLEDELASRKEWQRLLIISLLWYLWHLSFISNPDILANLKFFGIILLGTWGIGKVIQSTRSVLSVSCFHMIYNFLILRNGDVFSFGKNDKLIMIGICIVAWIIIIKLWEREKTS